MSEWLLYFILKLDGVNVFFGTLLAFSLTAILVYILLRICISTPWNDETERGEDRVLWVKKCKDNLKLICRYLRWSIPALIVSIFFLTALPTTNQMVLIYVIPKVVNNEHVQALPNEALRLFRDKIHEWTDSIEKGMLKDFNIGEKGGNEKGKTGT